MPVNQSKKETDVQNSLNSPLAAATNVNIVSNSWMANVEVNTQEFVNLVIQLPTYNASNWPVGQIVFVNEIFAPVVAGNSEWLGIDGRSISGATTFENKLYTWGLNATGQLGDNSLTNRCVPAQIAGGGLTWAKVTPIRESTTMGLKSDGTIWTWGSAYSGSLGDGTVINRSSPGTISGGGTTWCSLGKYMGAAIKTDGTLWTWGYNGSSGTLGDGTTTNRSSPGTTAGGGTNWCQVSSSMAVKTDGTLWTWGSGIEGRLGNNSTVGRLSPGTTAGGGTNWCQSSTGYRKSSAVKTDGTLWTWGCNVFGQLGTGTLTFRSSPGTTAGGGNSWCLVSAGYFSMSAIKLDGTLWVWGANRYGITGIGDGGGSILSPVTTVSGGTTWCQVETLREHVTAIKTDGTLWTWGRNGSGQLGTGTTTDRCSPGLVQGNTGSIWCFASGSCRSSFGINVENTVC